MKKVLCTFLALAMLILPMLALPVGASSAAEGMVSDLLPVGDDDAWLLSANDCHVRFNDDGSMTVKVIGTYPRLWLDMAYGDTIYLGDAIDVNRPAYFAVDFYTGGSIVLRQMLFHYTRKDKAALGTEADLWLESMYSSDYASYRVRSDGLPYDPMTAIPNGANRYVVWDWGGYLRDGSNKLFDDGMHHFTSLELDLTGSAVGSELTIYTMGVVSDPNVALGQHTPPQVEPGTEFSYEIEDGGAVVTAYNGYEADVVVPEKLGGCPVTAIGYGAFEGNFFIERVQLPETVTRIENSAFSWCFGLKEVNFPAGLTSIGESAFDSCALESLHLPASLTKIGDYAFYYCSDTLKSITVGAGNPVYEVRNNCLIDKKTSTLLLGCGTSVIPTGITTIGAYAFCGNETLKTAVIPEGVKYIDLFAFGGCTALTDVTLPNGLLCIEAGAFEECSSLRSIVVPDSVTAIYSGAFSYCTSLTSVTLSKNLTEFGNSVFYYCTELSGIELPDGVTALGDYTFWNCYSLSEIKLPSNLKSIGFSAFANNVSLRSIDLPEGLESIGAEAFIGGNLTNIVIPEGVKAIGEYAFYSNELTEAVIPASVTVMGDYVFGWCMGLTDVYCGAEQKPAGWSADWLGDSRSIAVHWGYKASKPSLGDLETDGVIDSLDYLLLKRYCLGTVELTDEQKAVADVNNDGAIDSLDYLVLKRAVLGTITIG